MIWDLVNQNLFRTDKKMEFSNCLKKRKDKVGDYLGAPSVALKKKRFFFF